MDIAIITAKQLIIMMTFMLIGYIFKKKDIFDEGSSKTLSRLVVNVFLPAMAFSTFAGNFKAEVIVEKSRLLLMSLIILTVTCILSVILAKLFSDRHDTQAVYIYSFTIPNLGFMGYPLVSAVFGEAALLDTMIFCIPYNIFIYTVGMYLLTPMKKITPKFLLTPALLAIFLGMLVGVSGITVPPLISGIFDMATACMSPCAMMLTGAVFARMSVKSMFADPRAYIASAIRLIIIPVAALFILRAIGVRSEWVLVATAILAMPLGLNSVVFPEAFGGDSETGAKICFMAGILGLITIPIVFGLIQVV